MESIKSNSIGKFVGEINNMIDETKSLEDQTEMAEYAIKGKVDKFRKRFKKMGEQLQSEELIKYINEDEELNKFVYKVYSILKGIEYKKQT
jgi:hypothetical protein